MKTITSQYRPGRVRATLGFAAFLVASGANAEINVDAAKTVAAPDGVEIRYETAGAGDPALIFIHGWSCDRSYWRAQMAHFAKSHRVVALDLGGHGESGFGREAWTIDSFGGDVAAVIDELGLERAVLIGHSMGGDVALAAARRLPGRIDGLVWVDTYRELGEPRSAAEV